MADTLPILIFKGDSSLCYGVLESFSRELRDAFLELGETVLFVDPDKDAIEDYIGKKYKAIIAFMENFFYSVMPDGELVFDKFEGPKFNYWTDYPAFYYNHVKRVPKDYYILTQDRNYVKFIDKYFTGVRAFYLPPGGRCCGEYTPFSDRKYNLSFVGTYLPWEDTVKSFNMSDENTRLIVERYLEHLVSNPDDTTEEAYYKVLRSFGTEVSDEQFVQQLSKLHRLADRGAARFYRQEIIQIILDSGYTIDVFGDSWKNAPFADNPFLRIHPQQDFSNISEIYKNSKLSLNIMTWHKDSITERVLDAMMAGSIVISDRTPALSEAFAEGEDIILYSLKKYDEIPELIRRYATNEQIALRGMKKAEEQHSWKTRALQLLEIIDKRTGL